MADTPNLNIRKLDGQDVALTDRINEALVDIDENALPISHKISKAHFDLWTPNTIYASKDVVRTETIQSWGYWQCTTGGVSGTTPPTGHAEGDTFLDGPTVRWKLFSLGSILGTIVHNDLAGRGVANTHPIEAITGLQDYLDTLITEVDAKAYTDSKITALVDNAPTTHNTLGKISTVITGILTNIEDIYDSLDDKVDKIAGKGLSTNDYDNDAKDMVDKLSESNSGKLMYDGNVVFEDIRNIVFVRSGAELIYPFKGEVTMITVTCAEPQAEDLLFTVEKKSKLDYQSGTGTWDIVGGQQLNFPANSAYVEYTTELASNLNLVKGDVIRAATAGSDSGVVFQISVKND